MDGVDCLNNTSLNPPFFSLTSHDVIFFVCITFISLLPFVNPFQCDVSLLNVN